MIKRRPNIIKRIWRNPGVQKAAGIILPVLFGVLILELWQTQVLHSWFHTDTFTLPLPGRILEIIGDNGPKILENTVSTIIVALAGLTAGSLVGYGIAALAPVMTNWTKDVSRDASVRSMAAKILVVMIVCIASMSINAFRGLTELKPYAEDLMLSYAAKKKTTFIKLRLPNSVPYIFTALRISVPASVIGALVSEYFAEYVMGVGRQIRENIVLAQYAAAWAYIAVACLIGIVMYMILMLAEGIIKKRRG